ncbi:hypothetical protein [Zoogloea sp.]|uniref:hypothetical protein n=1 Tax=Zoogloea sp. TaxID=49181 RepID=UPI0035B098A9
MTSPTPLSWASYLRWMLTTLAICVALVGAINVFVDPLGIFGSPRIPGINATKPYLDHHRDLTRWQAARRVCAGAGIFGNSRAEIGFDPRHPAFAAAGLSAFNYALPSAPASTIDRQLKWLASIGCTPKLAIVGVEFNDFLGTTKAVPLPPVDAPPQIDGKVLAETVFSLTGLQDSLKTLALQRARYGATLTELGFNPLDNYIAEVNNSGHYVLFRQRAEQNARAWRRMEPAIQPASGLSIDQQALEAVLAGLEAAGSTTRLVIYPYHAEIRLIQARLGLAGLFDDWRRMIVAMAARHPGVEVWDFSGIGPEVLEAIPAPGDRQTHLRNFWEAGHFKRELGDRVVARAMGEAGADSAFGLRLTPDNIDRALADDSRKLQALLATPSPLLAEVDDVVGKRR